MCFIPIECCCEKILRFHDSALKRHSNRVNLNSIYADIFIGLHFTGHILRLAGSGRKEIDLEITASITVLT